mmetsp:Transcript_46236/g.145019  ORF Transcript_46236/g.145019 Transcript_46236/m.145019 type:complete len:214 (-) Transcript_46236:587-1228(-)
MSFLDPVREALTPRLLPGLVVFVSSPPRALCRSVRRPFRPFRELPLLEPFFSPTSPILKDSVALTPAMPLSVSSGELELTILAQSPFLMPLALPVVPNLGSKSLSCGFINSPDLLPRVPVLVHPLLLSRDRLPGRLLHRLLDVFQLLCWGLHVDRFDSRHMRSLEASFLLSYELRVLGHCQVGASSDLDLHPGKPRNRQLVHFSGRSRLHLLG